MWIDTKLLNGITIGGGVPYVIPTDLRRRLAREWAGRTEDCLMTSFEHHGQMNSEVWISLMWGFVLAALRLDIPMSTTDLCILNVRSGGERSHVLSERSIIHYAYGDEFFNKKNFMSEDASVHTVWKAGAPEGTINGAVTGAIREAAVFYGLA